MKASAVLWPLATFVLGVLVGGYVLRKPDAPAAAVDAREVTAEYGQRLIRSTSLEMGSGQPDAARRYSGNNLACSSCHLESGQKPGILSLLQAAARYPTYSARDAIQGDLADRINGCMRRSMNGRPMPKDSIEMRAMVFYIEQLGKRPRATDASHPGGGEPPPFVEPDRQADVANGSRVFKAHCQTCHGPDGQGLAASERPGDGYLFPPLWGPDSYNIGAGMARVLTAARFIKARMPLGNPVLTDDEAFDVAAFINLQPRPAMANLERDYPDRKRKPVDSPYPPYADPFSVEQHRLGPFGPIRAHHEKAVDR